MTTSENEGASSTLKAYHKYLLKYLNNTMPISRKSALETHFKDSRQNWSNTNQLDGTTLGADDETCILN